MLYYPNFNAYILYWSMASSQEYQEYYEELGKEGISTHHVGVYMGFFKFGTSWVKEEFGCEIPPVSANYSQEQGLASMRNRIGYMWESNIISIGIGQIRTHFERLESGERVRNVHIGSEWLDAGYQANLAGYEEALHAYQNSAGFPLPSAKVPEVRVKDGEFTGELSQFYVAEFSEAHAGLLIREKHRKTWNNNGERYESAELDGLDKQVIRHHIMERSGTPPPELLEAMREAQIRLDEKYPDKIAGRSEKINNLVAGRPLTTPETQKEATVLSSETINSGRLSDLPVELKAQIAPAAMRSIER